jgi:hypothetical protein
MCWPTSKSPQLVASCLILSSALAYGQTSELSAFPNGRPAINSGTDLVPPRAIQFENGFSWSNDGRSRTLDGPESLMRVGLSSRVELQFTLPDAHAPGLSFDDPALGAKLRAGSETSTWPLAILGTVSIPTGSAQLTSGGVDPTLLLAISHNLPHELQFSGSVGVSSLSGTSGERSNGSQIALDLGWCVKPDACLFLEGAPFLATGAGNSGVTADTGMSLQLAPHLPFDWRVGATVQSSGSTVFVSLGYSFRQTRAPGRTEPRLHATPARYPRLEAAPSPSRAP